VPRGFETVAEHFVLPPESGARGHLLDNSGGIIAAVGALGVGVTAAKGARRGRPDDGCDREGDGNCIDDPSYPGLD
jgi:hypothetical protein